MLGYTYSLPKHPGIARNPMDMGSIPQPQSCSGALQVPATAGDWGNWGLAHFCSHSCYVIPTKVNMQKPEMCLTLSVMPADNRDRYIFI